MENDDDDWDLHAVVRSCGTASGKPTKSLKRAIKQDPSTPSTFPLSNPLVTSCCSQYQELDDLCMILTPINQEPKSKLSPSSPETSLAAPCLIPQSRLVSNLFRSKRRKNQEKRVVRHVAADGLSADMWAWRKYGQKPIKGSPYPRGYYRCSSSKECLARKQVERSRTDPGMFLIAYTAEHNHPLPYHRNSLSGTTRQKLPIATSEAGETPEKIEQVCSEEEGEEMEKDDVIPLAEDAKVPGDNDVLLMGSSSSNASSDIADSAACRSLAAHNDKAAATDGSGG